MKRYLELSSVMIVSILISCSRNGYYYGPEDERGWGPMMQMHYGFGYGGMFMWIIFVIVVGLLIYFIVQSQKTNGRTTTPHESPLDILKRRYAKGEITSEEYEKMKKDLQG
jgi:putative membrane protein